MTQSLERLTPDLSSGRDLTVRGIEPSMGLWADGAEPAWDPLSLSLPLLCSLKLIVKTSAQSKPTTEVLLQKCKAVRST